jgi:ABC-type transport system involved in cytochrome bd biosynthesis fused ATPase/permease subunit
VRRLLNQADAAIGPVAPHLIVKWARRRMREEIERGAARRSLLLRALVPAFSCIALSYLVMIQGDFLAPAARLTICICCYFFSMLIPWLVVKSERRRARRSGFLRR